MAIVELWKAKVKHEIKNSQIKTMFEVNKNLIMLYFRLKKIISENSEYGKDFIKNVSTKLKLEFCNMNGFSERNLNYMKVFYEKYKESATTCCKFALGT